jgi:APA family basic amino acid/polyamine antiporter
MPETNSTKDTALSRRLGLAAATLTGLGVIIGSGIYVIIGIAAGQAGNAVWLAFLLAATGASLTALSYARLGKLRPQNAPEYQFVNMAFGRRPAFLAGWLILLAQVVSASAVALGFAGYLNALTNIPELPAAIGLLLACMVVLYIGISQSALAAIIFTIIEILGLAIIIGIGAPKWGEVNYLEAPLGAMGVLSAASLVFFAYLGFEGMANLSEEMKDPERNLPRAILLALAISTGFYMLVAISAVSVVGWSALSQSNAPLALVAEQALGGNAGFILTIISLTATANTALVLLLAGSRILHAMSCAGVLPDVLCVVSRKRKTPWVAILAVGIVAVIFAGFRSIQQVAEFTNFITLAAFIGVNAAAIMIFRHRGSVNQFRHILLNIIIPVLGVLVSLWLAVNAGWRAAVFGVIVAAVGWLVYRVNNKFKGRGRA